ncbi:MAG: phosphatidate cytidylyltransferase [Steroidobacteraceae bacterium]
MLKQRIITALLIGLPVIAVLLWLPRLLTVMLFAVVVLLAGWEWSALARLQRPVIRGLYLLLLAAGMLLSWRYLHAGGALFTLLQCSLVWWLLALLWILLRPQLMSQPLAAVAGLMVLVPAWLTLALMHLQLPAGPQWVLFLFLMIVSADIGGFLFGRRFGHTKLAPRVSPGKTWEGVAGGLLLSMLVATAGGYWFAVPLRGFLPLCLTTVLMSVVGDLTESLFKRHAGLKDSGNLLPGHGGVLDRIDSMTAAAPVFLSGLLYLGVFVP